MVFEILYESAIQGELILLEGAFCHWHLLKNGQITIYEIIVLPEFQKQGLGRKILDTLIKVPGVNCIVARCPADLDANKWYKKQGFINIDKSSSKSGRLINTWKLLIYEA